MAHSEFFLQCQSHPALGDIAMAGDLLTVGRSEHPFDQLPADVAYLLSRRHARLFRDGEDYFIADLGSANGTRVNGQLLSTEDPHPLRDGDGIQIADVINFRVRIEAAQETEILPETPQQLVLRPAADDSPLSVIVIRKFPFLVSRNSNLFRTAGNGGSEQVQRLSRRHAFIVPRGDRLFIEDLGSRNGTWVNQEPLGEESRELSDGDILAFAGDYFVYRVELLPDAEWLVQTVYYPPAQAADALATAVMPASADVGATAFDEAEPLQQTMFVNSATSFLDIFCRDGSISGPGGEPEPGPPETPEERPGAGPWSRLTAPLQRGWKNQRTPQLLAVVALALGIGLVVLLFGSDRTRIRNLYQDGYYRESALLAEEYLSVHPDESDLQELAAGAMLHALVPRLVDYLNDEAHPRARALVAEYRSTFPHLDQGQEYLELLDWVVELDAYRQGRGDWHYPIRIFRDDLAMEALLAQWDKGPTRNQRLLKGLASDDAAFAAVYKRTLSSLRNLRHYHSLYGNAIAELLASLRSAIEEGDPARMAATVEEYRRNYPRLAGLDALLDDIRRYAALSGAQEDADLATVLQAGRRFEFSTPLFQEVAPARLSRQMPDQELSDGYTAAMESWARGDLETAVTVLQGLEAGVWQQAVDKLVTRLVTIDRQYRALLARRNEPDYLSALLAFRSRLQRPADRFYIAATEADFKTYEPALTAELSRDHEQARADWEAYNAAGGITSVTRIEDPISDRFVNQARRLASAHAASRRYLQAFQLLNRSPPKSWLSLADEIMLEIRRQRLWISDLGVVLDESLLKRKLDLLPEWQEESP